MSTSPPILDQIVKGATPQSPTLHDGASSVFAAPALHDANDRLASLKSVHPPHHPTDPTALLPSSPPQIYLNLLILEASLRSQYLTLRARRRQHSFVLILLSMWILFFTYVVWLRPREDGSGIGGSRYWLVDMLQKFCFITGCVTALLFWAMGLWERGVRWPRRWIGVANRGLRGTNAKIVVIRGSYWQELGNWARFVLPFGGGLWGGETSGSSYTVINVSQEKTEEDIAAGGDIIKLLLLPKPFTPDFREGWEIYRTEYWEKENERRAELRQRIHAKQRAIAREEGGWIWWTGWRGWKRARGLTGHGHSHSHSHAHHHHHVSHTGSLKDRKRRPSTLRGRDGSTNSRSSSRSTTPTPDLDERLRTIENRERRWSNSTTGSTASTRPESRRKKAMTTTMAPGGSAQMARQPSSRLSSGSGSRPNTPSESLPWQSKRASGLSTAESLRDEGEGFDGGGPVLGLKRRTSGEGEDGFAGAPSGA